MDAHVQPDRVRKRRRRTMACTQCRSRKLKCDREYPTCSRCLKSKTPTQCTYEDGFLWQQPTTVGTTSFAPDRGSTVSMHQGDHTPAETPPDAEISKGPPQPEPFIPSEPTPSHPLHHVHHGLSGHALAPTFRGHPPGRERRDCFLETVLGAPKAAVRQEPHVNSGLLQRRKRPAPDFDMNPSSLADDDHETEEEILSPSGQLDLSPRVMMRGRETKTRFSGSGIFANLVTQVSISFFSFFLFFFYSSVLDISTSSMLIPRCSFLISNPLQKRSSYPILLSRRSGLISRE